MERVRRLVRVYGFSVSQVPRSANQLADGRAKDGFLPVESVFRLSQFACRELFLIVFCVSSCGPLFEWSVLQFVGLFLLFVVFVGFVLAGRLGASFCGCWMFVFFPLMK